MSDREAAAREAQQTLHTAEMEVCEGRTREHMVLMEEEKAQLATLREWIREVLQRILKLETESTSIWTALHGHTHDWFEESSECGMSSQQVVTHTAPRPAVPISPVMVTALPPTTIVSETVTMSPVTRTISMAPAPAPVSPSSCRLVRSPSPPAAQTPKSSSRSVLTGVSSMGSLRVAKLEGNSPPQSAKHGHASVAKLEGNSPPQSAKHAHTSVAKLEGNSSQQSVKHGHTSVARFEGNSPSQSVKIGHAASATLRVQASSSTSSLRASETKGSLRGKLTSATRSQRSPRPTGGFRASASQSGLNSPVDGSTSLSVGSVTIEPGLSTELSGFAGSSCAMEPLAQATAPSWER